MSDINISGGGPIIARKLRIFTSFRDWRVHVNVPAAFSTLVLDKTDITSGLINANYQFNDNNRLTGLYSRQYYKKPNRFLTASNVTVLESTSNEDDVFDIYQVLWNSVVTQRFFIDARVGLNKIFFPTYLNGNDQTLLDSATNIRTRNATTGTERWRDRYQTNTTGQYYVDEALGGRHEFKFGFDYSHMPVENRDVALRRCRHDLQQRDRPRAERDAVCDAVLHEDRRRRARAVRAGQRLVEATDGDRRPALGAPQRLPAGTEQPGQPVLPQPARARSPRIRTSSTGRRSGPRISAAYDLMGNGRTGLKIAAGRYYYVIASGGGILDGINPNGNYSEQYTWNDVERRSPLPARRTDRHPGDHARRHVDDLGRSRLPASLHRRVHGRRRSRAVPGAAPERDRHAPRRAEPAGDVEPGQPVRHVPDDAPRHGRDGVAGTADDTTFQFYNRTSTAVNQTFFTNDRNYRQTYNGLEITGTKRMSNRWQMLVGYTYRQTRRKGFSVNTNPNT